MFPLSLRLPISLPSHGCRLTYGSPLRNREGLGCNRPQTVSMGLYGRVRVIPFPTELTSLLGCSQDLSSFVDQPDVITHVAIVNPKPGVFVDEINHLLVLCTPLTVMLLGVSATDVLGPNHKSRKEIKLFDLDMSMPCDVEMISVAGTADGRIFMAGSQDGHLYELHYQEKEGWFGRRVQLINHSVGSVQSFFPRFTPARGEGMFHHYVAQP